MNFRLLSVSILSSLLFLSGCSELNDALSKPIFPGIFTENQKIKYRQYGSTSLTGEKVFVEVSRELAKSEQQRLRSLRIAIVDELRKQQIEIVSDWKDASRVVWISGGDTDTLTTQYTVTQPNWVYKAGTVENIDAQVRIGVDTVRARGTLTTPGGFSIDGTRKSLRSTTKKSVYVQLDVFAVANDLQAKHVNQTQISTTGECLFKRGVQESLLREFVKVQTGGQVPNTVNIEYQKCND